MSKGWSYLNPSESFPDLDSNSTFIALLGLEFLPPHVVLIYRNNLFSFSIRGVEIHHDARRVLKKIWGTRACAIIECTALTSEGLPLSIYSIFDTLQKGASCIDPILEIIKQEWNIIPEKPYLHGLLQALHENGKIRDCYISFFGEGRLELKSYDRTDIDKRIAELSQKPDKR